MYLLDSIEFNLITPEFRNLTIEKRAVIND